MSTNNTTPDIARLYRKIAAVAGGVTSVEKDGQNKDQKYRYATPAGIMSAVKPLLAEQGLAIVPHLVDYAEIDTGQRSSGGKPFLISRVTMHYHIVDGESGGAIVVPWQAQAGTYGDDKGLAKAQTIALRTFLVQLFQIPAEDPDTDPDRADPRPDDRTTYAPQQVRQPRPASLPVRPAPPAAATSAPTRREKLLARIDTLTQEAINLELEIELVIPLDQMTDDQLVDHGTRLKAAITEATSESVAA
jgi:hypothetical protein